MIKENSRLQNQTTHWKIGKNKNQMILHNKTKLTFPKTFISESTIFPTSANPFTNEKHENYPQTRIIKGEINEIVLI